MEQLTQVFDYILNIPTEVYVTVLGATGISILTQVSKKLLALENEKLVVVMLTGFSVLASGVDYLLSSHAIPPTFAIFGHTVNLIGVATPLYIWVLKPATIFLADVKAYRGQLVAKTEDITKQQLDQPATEPTPFVPSKSSAVFPSPTTEAKPVVAEQSAVDF